MALTAGMANTVATYVGTQLPYLSVHTGDPGSTGANEASGGSYARQANSWGSASSGSIVGAAKTFTPGAGTYTFAGYWSASTAGTFLGSIAITSKTLGATDTITVTPTFTETMS